MDEDTTHFASPVHGTLSARVWPAREPRGALVFLHGWGDHAGRYAELARPLAEAGFSCFAPDFAGHGLSPGPRARVHAFEPLVQDLRSFLTQRVRCSPVFLCGHSMGGTLAAHYAIRFPEELAGVIFSSAALAVNRSIPWLKRAAAWSLGGLAPRVSVGLLKHPHHMAGSAAAQAQYERDPLIHHGPIDAGTGRCLLLANRWLERHRRALRSPFLALQGDADELVCPRGPHALARAAPGPGSVMTFAGRRHDLLLELGAQALSALMLAWLAQQVRAHEALATSR
jgi:alpha-beta hydrolase superfamily lysophospholipase